MDWDKPIPAAVARLAVGQNRMPNAIRNSRPPFVPGIGCGYAATELITSAVAVPKFGPWMKPVGRPLASFGLFGSAVTVGAPPVRGWLFRALYISRFSPRPRG